MRSLEVALCLAAILQPLAAAGQIMVVSNAVQERVATPGESYTGTIRLRNTSSAAQEVRVYQTGYLFYADGRALHPPPNRQPRSNAAWMTVTPTHLVIPADGEAEVGYSVNVPSDGAAAGTYWSMIMVEPAAKAATDSKSTKVPSVGVRTVVRFGIQVATHVPGNAVHRLRITNGQVVIGAAGKRELVFEIANEGEAGYKPKVSVEIFDAQGTAVAEFESQRGLIYPGTSAVHRVDLKDLKRGYYEALVVVDTGAPEVFGAQFKLNLNPSR